MIVLGLDPGLRATGYGALEFGGPRARALEFGVWRPSAGTLAERLEFLFSRAEGVLERLRPSAVSVETLFAGKNIASAVALAEVRGVLLLAAARAGVPVYEYAPLAVKKTVTGYGRAEKPQVREMVRSLLALQEPRRIPLDAADALAAALCHCHHAGPGGF